MFFNFYFHPTDIFSFDRMICRKWFGWNGRQFRYFYYFNRDNCLKVYIGSFVGKSRWIDSREKKITLQDFRYPDRKLPLVRHTFRKITLFPRVRIKCLTTLFFHLFHPPPIISTHWPPHPRLIITTHGEKTVPETREVIGRWMSLRISILESRIYFALECIRLDPKNTTCVACP